MRIVFLLSALVSLASCASGLVFIPHNGGGIYKGSAEFSLDYDGKMKANIEGEDYEGEWLVVKNGGAVASTFGQSNSTVTANAYGRDGPVTGNAKVRTNSHSYTVVNSADGSGDAYMYSQSGKQIRCRFHYNQMSGSGRGICERNDGELYDMLIK